MLKNESKIKVLTLIIFIGFTLSVFFYYVMGFYLYKNWPENTFLFNPPYHFTDFFNSLTDPHLPYLPFCIIIIRLFTLIQPDLYSFILFTGIFISFVFYYVWTNLKDQQKTDRLLSTVILAFLTFPFLFMIDRSNFEALVFIALAISVGFFAKEKYWMSAGFLAVAISMKLFPAVFLVLFVSERKFKELLFILLAVIVLTLVSQQVVHSTIEPEYNTISNMGLYTDKYALGDDGLDFGHTLYGMLKVFLGDLYASIDVSLLMNVYLVFTLFVFSIMTLYIIIVEHALWKKVAILTISMCLLPYVSCDYKLIYLLMPLLLFVNTGEKSRYDLIYTVLLGLLLVPKKFGIIHLNGMYDGVIIDPILMTLFVCLIVYDGLKSSSIETVRTKVRSIRDAFLQDLNWIRREKKITYLYELLLAQYRKFRAWWVRIYALKSSPEFPKALTAIISIEIALLLIVGSCTFIINPYLDEVNARNNYAEKHAYLEKEHGRLLTYYHYTHDDFNDEYIYDWIKRYDKLIESYGIAYSDEHRSALAYLPYVDNSSEEYGQILFEEQFYNDVYNSSVDYLYSIKKNLTLKK